MGRADSLEKTLILGKIEGVRRRGRQRMRLVGRHHQLDGHEFEQALGVGDGQGSLAWCSPWGCKELDRIEWLNWTELRDCFPGSSASNESVCNVGDPGLIPGSGSSPGEGIGYPLQYSWTSLMAKMVKNLPVMQETWVWSLGWEDPLEKGMVTHSWRMENILAWRMAMDREPGGL